MTLAPADLSRIACLRDYETLARERLAPGVWAYLNAGAADQITQGWNEQAFQRRSLLPRVLRGTAGGSTGVTLLGQQLTHPILIAPTAYHALAHPDAERATAVAAAAMKAVYVASTLSSVTLEDIARTRAQALAQAQAQGDTQAQAQTQVAQAQCGAQAQAQAPHQSRHGSQPDGMASARHGTTSAALEAAQPAPLWFQLYLQPDREVSLDLMRRAEQAGYQAIVITVDAPIQGLRNEDQRQGFQMPAQVQAANLTPYASRLAGGTLAAGASLFSHPLVTGMATWDDIAWLAGQTRLPVLLKGILNPLDVPPALDAGAAGLIVSNHGGRALDTLPATLDALPAVAAAASASAAFATVAAARGRVPVLMDGGIRRGTDVLKALALGADAVLVGRPVLHGLAAAGATGVAHVLNLLRSELEAAMVLAGCRTLPEAGESLLLPGRPTASS